MVNYFRKKVKGASVPSEFAYRKLSCWLWLGILAERAGTEADSRGLALVCWFCLPLSPACRSALPPAPNFFDLFDLAVKFFVSSVRSVWSVVNSSPASRYGITALKRGHQLP